MNHRMMVGLIVAGCLGVGPTLLAQHGEDVSSKVQQLEQEMLRAEMNNDATWLQQHLDDGYIEGNSWGEWTTKASLIKQVQDKSMKFTKGEIGDVKVATFDPNVAIAHYKFTYNGTINGTHRARTVICSNTWISQSGDWKLASSHCSHVEGK